MQREAELIELPPGFEISKSKIGGHFAFMKGAEWRTWVLALSPILLKNRLPPQHLKIWLKFVRANKLLAGPSITANEIDRAHMLLKQFCAECEEFFETTYMRGFLELDFADNFVTEKSRWFAGKPDFLKILTRLAPQLSPPLIDPTINAIEFDLNAFANYAEKWNGRLEVSGLEPLPPSTFPLDLKPYVPISNSYYDLLLAYYRHMYPYNIFKSYHIEDINAPGEMVGDMIQKMISIKILGQLYRSEEARSKKGIGIQALFSETNNNGNLVIHEGWQHTEMRYGRTAYFFVYRIRLDQEDVASITTQRSHGLMECCNHFHRMTLECILPVYRIFSPIAVAPNGPDKLVVIPLPRKTTG
ncbi:hypothetical protein INT45_013953 [Circinella minor]|uniref:Uncharacterized protein n=1 Tax=Circinella minor TaxID=1195481 RepID=A0A8H7RRZ5_9FUNG|nr:hypothetical protein INT45_013953 [Circinella minor]